MLTSRCRTVAASVKRQAISYGRLLASPDAFMANARPKLPASSTIASKHQDSTSILQKVAPTATKTASKQDGSAMQQKVASAATKIASKQEDGHRPSNAAAPLATAPKVRFTIPSQAVQKAKRTISTKSTSSTSTQRVSTGNNVAIASNFMTISSTSHTVDLMDLDVGEESSAQPVIEFTHSPGKSITNESAKQQPVEPAVHTLLADYFRLLEQTGRLKADEIDQFKAMTKKAEAEADADAKPKTANVEEKALRKERYTRSELFALRPSATLASTALPTAPRKQLRPDNPSRSLVKHLEAVREAKIGEHIYKGRWVDPATLVSGMAKLSLQDKVSGPTTTTNPTSTGYAKTNPFGPAKSTTTAYDRGAVARAQYGGTPAPANPMLSPTTRADDSPERGSATRRTHCGMTPAPTTPVPSLTPTTTRTAYTRSQGTAPRGQQAARGPSGTGPALPAFLQGLTPTETGAAAREQYGGGSVLAPLTNNNQAPARKSRINDSGFIGMAERARKGQDPLEKSRQLGL